MHSKEYEGFLIVSGPSGVTLMQLKIEAFTSAAIYGRDLIGGFTLGEISAPPHSPRQTDDHVSSRSESAFFSLFFSFLWRRTLQLDGMVGLHRERETPINSSYQ